MAISERTGRRAPPAPSAKRRAWKPRMVLAGLCLALALQVLGTYTSLHPGWLPFAVSRPAMWLPATALPYLAALALLSRARLSQRAVAGLVLAGTALLQWIALTRPPLTSNDALRYIWDGKVQLAGIDPYRYLPEAPELAPLHEPLLFTANDCAVPTGCTLLNHPYAHTIYPPVAQAAFALIRLASFGGHGGLLAFQIAAALGVLAVTALLLRRARRRSLALWPAAVWGWCPIVVSEYGNNAHIDWLAVLLSVVGLSAYVAARPRWAGALLGAAISVKLYPALLLPSLLRRHPLRVLGAALAVLVAGYLPHVLAVGAQVVGYLPGYLSEEGYDSGSRLVLIGRVAPHPIDTAIAMALLAGLAWLAYRRSDPDNPERSAVWLVGAAFLIATPNYGWYAGILVALVAMTREWQWLPVAFAPTCTYLYRLEFADRHLADTLIYLAAGIAAAAIWGVRRRMAPMGSPGADAT